MNKIIVIVGFAFLFFKNPLVAQQSKKMSKQERKQKIAFLAKQEEEGIIAYKKHLAQGIIIANNGFGGFIEYGKTKNIRRASLYQLEISEITSRKEIRYTASTPLSAASYKYGKWNYLYNLKFGYQEQFLIGNKTSKNGINITLNTGGGIALGLVKPYSLKIAKTGSTDTIVRYDKNLGPDQLYLKQDVMTVLQASSILTRWQGTSISPGVYLKPAVRFDYGKYNEIITAVEVGCELTYYFNNPQLMAIYKNKPLHYTAFVRIVSGRRR